jgi:maltose-binding protein MalE
MMLKNYLIFSMAVLLAFGAIAPTVTAASKGQRLTTEEVKSKVFKLGTGSKAKATVWLADGRKVKGYVSQAGDEDFVMRDRKTDAPTTVRYADVVKFERNNGHSTAKWAGIGAGIGVGAFVLILVAIFANLND